MKNYKIIHNWKHVQGHTVYQRFYKEGLIQAENEEDAILKFMELRPNLAQHMKKDEDGDWIYGSVSAFNWDYMVKNNQVKAIETTEFES